MRSPPAIGGASIEIRCSTASCAMRLPRTPMSASPKPGCNAHGLHCAKSAALASRRSGSAAARNTAGSPGRRSRREAHGRPSRCRAGRCLRSRSFRPGQPARRSRARRCRRGRGGCRRRARADRCPIPSAPMPMQSRRPSGSRSPSNRRVARSVAGPDRAAAPDRPGDRSRYRAHRRRLRDQRRADIPLLEAERQGALFRLATLTGRTPRDLPAQPAGRTSTLAARPADPGRRRRDTARAAARRSRGRAPAGRVDSADRRRDRRPLSAHHARRLARIERRRPRQHLRREPADLAGRAADQLDRNRSAARARVAEARADTQAALATFDGTVLEALQETETALSSYQQALNRREALARRPRPGRDGGPDHARASARGRHQLARTARCRTDCSRSRSSARRSRREHRSSQIDLFRSLGGGWNDGTVLPVSRKQASGE